MQLLLPKDGNDQVEDQKWAEEKDYNELKGTDCVVIRFGDPIHEDGPAFQGCGLEDCDECIHDWVEVGHAPVLLGNLGVPFTLPDDRLIEEVQAGHDYIWPNPRGKFFFFKYKVSCAVRVSWATKVTAAQVFYTLVHGPDAVDWNRCESAVAMCGAIPQVDRKDGQNCEKEQHEHQNVTQWEDRIKHCGQQFLHRWYRVEWAQWSQQPKRSQRWNIPLRVKIALNWRQHYEEVEPIPRVAQLGPVVNDETHRNNFAYGLEQEDDTEYVICRVWQLVP